MTANQLNRLAAEHARNANECAAAGYRTIAAVNREMSDYYYSRAAAKKPDNDVNSDTD